MPLSTFINYRGAVIEIIPHGSRYAFNVHLDNESTAGSVKINYLTQQDAISAAKLVLSLIH